MNRSINRIFEIVKAKLGDFSVCSIESRSMKVSLRPDLVETEDEIPTQGYVEITLPCDFSLFICEVYDFDPNGDQIDSQYSDLIDLDGCSEDECIGKIFGCILDSFN